MNFFTSYFSNIRKLKFEGIVPINIARFPPKFYQGLSYKPLMPYGTILKLDEEEFRNKFSEMLKGLNPEKVVRELAELSKGQDLALVCYEAPANFCHRHLVADWLNFYTKESVIEFVPEEKPTEKQEDNTIFSDTI